MGDKRKLLFVLWQIIIWDNRLHETRHSFVLTLLQLLVVMRQGDEILNLLLWPLADYVMPVHKLDKAHPPPPPQQLAPEQKSEGQGTCWGGPGGSYTGEKSPADTWSGQKRQHHLWLNRATCHGLVSRTQAEYQSQAVLFSGWTYAKHAKLKLHPCL